METRRGGVCARPRASADRSLSRIRHRGRQDKGRRGSLGRRRESRRNRRAYQPLGDLPRLRAESRYGSGLFQVHRAVRLDPAGYLDAGARMPGTPRGSDRGDCGRVRARVRPRDNGERMIDVEMPQMGESIVEGTLTKWLKKPGDKVERDEPLFEISTDKVDTEIPSPAAGTLAEILVEEGKTVGINTVVGRISDGAGSSATTSSAAQSVAALAAAVAPPPPAPQATVAQ